MVTRFDDRDCWKLEIFKKIIVDALESCLLFLATKWRLLLGVLMYYDLAFGVRKQFCYMQHCRFIDMSYLKM